MRLLIILLQTNNIKNKIHNTPMHNIICIVILLISTTVYGEGEYIGFNFTDWNDMLGQYVYVGMTYWYTYTDPNGTNIVDYERFNADPRFWRMYELFETTEIRYPLGKWCCSYWNGC